jgi:uncharacterized protein YcfJ
MRHILASAAFAAAVIALPHFAMADGSGAVTGAGAGAVTGAIVGGPVGAAVGAGVGGVAGGALSGPEQPRTRVIEEPPVTGTVRPCSTETTRTENEYGDSRTTTTERCD